MKFKLLYKNIVSADVVEIMSKCDPLYDFILTVLNDSNTTLTHKMHLMQILYKITKYGKYHMFKILITKTIILKTYFELYNNCYVLSSEWLISIAFIF